MKKTDVSIEIPFSEACERNKDPILSAIDSYLDRSKSVLEIGSGTAQHAVYFSRVKPHLVWQTSDQSQYLAGIEAQLEVAMVENVLRPLTLDVNQDSWLESQLKYDLVYTANTFHIMAEQDVVAFFCGLPSVMCSDSALVVYGPFKYQGKFTSESNAAFDHRLRDRGVGSGIRDFEWVNELAEGQGLSLAKDQVMPANNQCLIWTKRSAT